MKIPKPIAERRRAVRIQEELPFTIGHEGYELEAVSVNISSRGALCVLPRQIPLMTQLHVCFCLPGREIRARGVVVRHEKDPAPGRFRTAIYFTRVNPQDEKALRAYLGRGSNP